MEFESVVKGGLPVKVKVESYAPYRPSSRWAEDEGGEVEITICWLSGRPMGDAVLSTISEKDKYRLQNEAYEFVQTMTEERRLGI